MQVTTASRLPGTGLRRRVGADLLGRRAIDLAGKRCPRFRHAASGNGGEKQRLLPRGRLQLGSLGGERGLVEGVALGERDDLLLLLAAPRRTPSAPRARCDRRRRCPRQWHRPGAAARRQRSTWPRNRVPRPGALVRAFDQARNVGQHEIARRRFDHAEIGMQRREGIVGDLRLGARSPSPGRWTCRRWAAR